MKFVLSTVLLSLLAGCKACPEKKFVLRVDDVQDWFMKDHQLALIQYCMDNDISISLGVIGGSIGTDAVLVDKIKDCLQLGEDKCEIYNHGLDLENLGDSGALTVEEIQDKLEESHDKIVNVLGFDTRVAAPHANLWGDKLITALDNMNYKILSASSDEGMVFNLNLDVLHMPQQTEIAEYVDGSWNRVEIADTIASCEAAITNGDEGCVIMVHPQNFAPDANGDVVYTLNDVETLVTNLTGSCYNSTTFEGLAAGIIEEKNTTVTVNMGCCSNNYKDCDATWCGTTEEACNSCPGGLKWLEDPDDVDANCFARYASCSVDSNTTECCEGLICTDDGSGSFASCLPPATPPPTSSPTSSPTKAPTSSPTTAAPTKSPTAAPTAGPTASPTASPTAGPTASPTSSPTVNGATMPPTKSPTVSPTTGPTTSPTTSPTKSPTLRPTASPTRSPTRSPTGSPTITRAPTSAPTAKPTGAPTTKPTQAPTPLPTPAAGCCSQDFKTCNASWHTTKDACDSVGTQIWLDTGALDIQCSGKDSGETCDKNAEVSDCCPGLECIGSIWWASCNLI